MSKPHNLSNYGIDQWSLPGYTVAKTKHYISKSLHFSPTKRETSPVLKSIEKNPDPAKYSDSLEQTFKRFWKKSSGGFSKLKKRNFLDEIIKNSKKIPGPGSYNKLPNKNFDCKRKSPLGKFDKSERTSFMSEIEYSAEETPSSWKYKPTMPEKKLLPTWKQSKVVKLEKTSVGPGKYEEGMKKAYEKIMKNSPNFSFARSKTPSLFEANAKKMKNFPGVGAYLDSDVAYIKCKGKRSPTAVIYPHKIRSFTESVIKKAEETPGPGSYEIIPEVK